MSTTHNSYLALVFVATLAVASTHPAVAGTHDEPRSVTVRYGDLDLSRDDGARVMYRRLKSAVRRVCDVGQSLEPARKVVAQRCAEKSLGEAVAKIDNANVTALYFANDARAPGPRLVADGR